MFFNDLNLFVISDMAQNVFQMPGMWHDVKYEKLQRLRQTTLLQCVSINTADTCLLRV